MRNSIDLEGIQEVRLRAEEVLRITLRSARYTSRIIGQIELRSRFTQ
jgi:hypothetical protein